MPGLSGYFPGSDRPEYTYEQELIDRALRLQQRGYDVGAYINPGDPYLGKAVEAGNLYYAHPNVPGYHFEQNMTEGSMRPPVMLPGGMQERYDLERATREAYGYDPFETVPADVRRPSAQAAAYDAILREIRRRAYQGDPLRR